jgi:hypothetical protein
LFLAVLPKLAQEHSADRLLDVDFGVDGAVLPASHLDLARFASDQHRFLGHLLDLGEQDLAWGVFGFGFPFGFLALVYGHHPLFEPDNQRRLFDRAYTNRLIRQMRIIPNHTLIPKYLHTPIIQPQIHELPNPLHTHNPRRQLHIPNLPAIQANTVQRRCPSHQQALPSIVHDIGQLKLLYEFLGVVQNVVGGEGVVREVGDDDGVPQGEDLQRGDVFLEGERAGLAALVDEELAAGGLVQDAYGGLGGGGVAQVDEPGEVGLGWVR